jgi:hypothetical protein
MAFSINLLPEPVLDVDPGVTASYGEIEIGSFRERFVASLMYWRANDYKSHWDKALERIVYQSDTSCLITSIVDPSVASHLFWWPMYRVNDVIYIQNQILFFEHRSSPFNERECFSYVSGHRTLDEDGSRISEWSVPVEDIESFLRSDKRVAP